MGGIVLASTEFATANSLVRGLPPLKPRRKVVLMRKRNHRIVFYLDDAEFKQLMRNVTLSKYSREAYIRSVLGGYVVREAPPADYYKMLSKISRESANLNQLLVVARTKGFIDTPQLRNLMEDIRSTNKMLWQTFSEERNGNN